MARQCSLGGKDLHTPRRKGVVEVAEENAQLKNSLVALQQQLVSELRSRRCKFYILLESASHSCRH